MKLRAVPVRKCNRRRARPSQSGSEKSNGSVAEGGRLGIKQAGFKWKMDVCLVKSLKNALFI